MLNNFRRYQQGFNLDDLFPKTNDGTCSCGCGTKLKGRQSKWSSEKCNDEAYKQFAILKGNTGIIRKELYKTEKGYCRACGVKDEKWEADHIIPVFQGGGACLIENFQTLCEDCHKDKSKTQIESHRRAISSQDASSLPNKRLYAEGASL